MINIILLFALLISIITDLKERKIYNLITFPAIIAGLLIHTWNSGLDGFLFSLAGFGLGIGLLFIPFLLGGMGAGDVKLLGAIGALKGAAFVFHAFFLIAIIGGVIAVMILLTKKEFKSFIVRTFFSMQLRTIDGLSKEEMHHAFPYGVAIVCGTLVYMGVGVV